MSRCRLHLHALAILALVAGFSVEARAVSSSLQKRVDSLFVLASTGEVRYKDLVQPAKDSIAALGVDAVPILIDKCDTKSAPERVTLMEILKKIGKPAVPDLVKALKRQNGLIVERVCAALADIADSGSVPALIGVTGHPRWQVREQAVGALGKCRDHRADPIVASALTDTIGQVRKSAAVASGQLKLNDLIPPLVHMLADDFYGARMCALETLLGLDTAKVIRIITDSMLSSNKLVGDRACTVLGQFHTPQARELLMEQTKSDAANRRAHAGVALITADPLDSCGLQRQFVDPEKDPLVKLKLHSAVVAGKTATK